MNQLFRYSKILLLFFWLASCLWVSADLPGLQQLYEWDKYHNYAGGHTDGEGLKNVFIQVFKNIAICLFIIAAILVFIATTILLSSKNDEENFLNWSHTLTWGIMGLLLASITYTVVRLIETRVLSTPSISGTTIYNTTINIIYPIVNFLRFLAGTMFFFWAIYGFYNYVTANGDEEHASKWKKLFIGCAIGFIIMYIAEVVVKMSYGGWLCGGRTIFGVPVDCINRIFDTVWVFWTIAKVIVFLNSFVALVVLILIIYGWFLILTGAGNEEHNENLKRVIIYATIGIIILIFSYAIYKFMILMG